MCFWYFNSVLWCGYEKLSVESIQIIALLRLVFLNIQLSGSGESATAELTY